MSTALLLLLWIGLFGVVVAVTAPVTITQDWGGRFQGDLTFTVPENMAGWEVKLNFSAPVGKIDVRLFYVVQFAETENVLKQLLRT